jgi:hypothetical protein
MITSKFKVFGVFALIFSGILFIGICYFIYVLISVIFLGGHTIPRGTLPPFGAILFVAIFVLFLIIIIISWIRYAFIVKIDKKERSIYFKNIVTQQTSFYKFDDFESYIDTYPITAKGGNYKVLYLLKNKKAEKIITGFYYVNIDELQDAISSIKYLGFQKNFATIARRALLNRVIFED